MIEVVEGGYETDWMSICSVSSGFRRVVISSNYLSGDAKTSFSTRYHDAGQDSSTYIITLGRCNNMKLAL
jgi:hypothetical protein